jgi:hypothetical protein
MQLIKDIETGTPWESESDEEVIMVNINQIGNREISIGGTTTDISVTDDDVALSDYDIVDHALSVNSVMALSTAATTYNSVPYYILAEAMQLAGTLLSKRLDGQDTSNDTHEFLSTRIKDDIVRRVATSSRKSYGMLLIAADSDDLSIDSVRLLAVTLLRPLTAHVRMSELIELFLVWYQVVSFASFASRRNVPMLDTKDNVIRSITESGGRYRFKVIEVGAAVDVNFLWDYNIESGDCDEDSNCEHGCTLSSFIASNKANNKLVLDVKYEL